MPETATTPKSCTSSLSAPSSTREETNHFAERNLMRCVRRRFQTYSQLPVRCQRTSPYYRPPRTSFKLVGLSGINRAPSISTAKSCPESSPCATIFRAMSTPRCKRSLSMIDLSPVAIEPEIGDFRSDSSSNVERLEDVNDRMKEIVGNIGNNSGGHGSLGIGGWMDEFVSPESEAGGSRFFENPRKAASLICRVLVLNAWRRRRAEIVHLRDSYEILTGQIEHLHLQIVVLRRLLDTENSRVGRLTADVHRAKSQLDEASRERDSLKMEKEKSEEEIKHLAELSEERKVVAENVRNELLTAQSQLRALDEQISRDREKLLKLREDKKILLEKVTASEALAREREDRAEIAESKVEDLQLSLATQIALVESVQEQIQRYSEELKLRVDEKTELEKQLRSSEEVGRSLNLRAVSLEAQLVDREAELRRIESAYNSQLTELNELRQRLVQQSQVVGWSSRMLQIAGSVVRAPRAFLRTLSLLSSTGAALPS